MGEEKGGGGSQSTTQEWQSQLGSWISPFQTCSVWLQHYRGSTAVLWKIKPVLLLTQANKGKKK